MFTAYQSSKHKIAVSLIEARTQIFNITAQIALTIDQQNTLVDAAQGIDKVLAEVIPNTQPIVLRTCPECHNEIDINRAVICGRPSCPIMQPRSR